MLKCLKTAGSRSRSRGGAIRMTLRGVSRGGSAAGSGWAKGGLSQSGATPACSTPASGSRTSESHPITVSPITKMGEGKLGLCYCPGKNLVREGIKWERDLDADLRRLKEAHRVDVVVCLLSPAEIRSLGVRRDFAQSVTRHKMKLINHPIIEMAAPDDISSACGLVERIVDELDKGMRCVMHCRGGMGRAGMMAACVLLRRGECSKAKEAIETVRKRRGRGAVESRAQEDFVAKYSQRLVALSRQAASEPGAADTDTAAAAAAPFLGDARPEPNGVVVETGAVDLYSQRLALLRQASSAPRAADPPRSAPKSVGINIDVVAADVPPGTG